MNSTYPLAIALSLTFFHGQAVSAQDLSRYRAYVLESSVEAVAAASGARANDARTLHGRPAKIREVAFTFLNDALYQVVVTYNRDRTEGLTNDDIIASLSESYGAPVLKKAISRYGLPSAALLDTLVLAQWDDVASSLTLLRDTYSPEFQLILVSKPLSARARSAIREATRLDALEAPRRELEQRNKEVADASAARDKSRSTNKAAFRP
jgi:hypothetical protein